MKKSRYYVVWKGRLPGIYPTWEACSAQVSGYPQAEYKAFESLAAAQAAYQGKYASYKGKPTGHQQWLFAPTQPVTPSICVDAACSGSPGPVEYRGVETESGREIFRQGPYADGTNNVGEFLALVHALGWLADRNLDIPLYSDSENGIAWVKARVCRTKLARTDRNTALFDLISRAEAKLKTINNLKTFKILKWDTRVWGEIPADFGRK
jgi:ribonuclease HI